MNLGHKITIRKLAAARLIKVWRRARRFEGREGIFWDFGVESHAGWRIILK